MFDFSRQSHQLTWSEFRKYIDGTYFSASYSWSLKSSIYLIVTEELGGVRKECSILINGNADQLDFEANFKNLPPRSPLNFRVSGSVIVTSTGSLPITGSVNVTNSLFNITGSVGVNNTVRVTGSLGVDNVVRVTSTGSLPVTAQISVSGTLVTTNNPLPVTQAGSSYATFTVIALNTAIGNNKSMLSIYNPVGSGRKLKLREFYIRNPQTSAVTGIAGDFRIYRFSSVSAPTGGATVTAVTHDTDDVLSPGVDCRTGGTISGEEANPLDRILMSTDEWGPGTLDVEANQQAIANYLPARAKRDPQLKAFTANPGQGLHLKHVVNSTAGTMDIIFVMTQETS